MSTIVEEDEVPVDGHEHEEDVGVEDVEAVDLLISAVRKRPALYDVGHEDFKNLAIRNGGWAAVGAEIGKSGLWCKSEWVKRRAAYVRKRKFLREKTSPGHRRKLIMRDPYYRKMAFLDGTLVSGSAWSAAAGKERAERKQSRSRMMADSEDSGESRSEVDDDPLDDPPKTPEIKLGLGLTSFTNLARLPTPASNGARKQQSFSFQSESSSSLPRVEKTQGHDEYYHYCQSLAERMRKLEPEMASYLILKIDELVQRPCTNKFLSSNKNISNYVY